MALNSIFNCVSYQKIKTQRKPLLNSWIFSVIKIYAVDFSTEFSWKKTGTPEEIGKRFIKSTTAHYPHN